MKGEEDGREKKRFLLLSLCSWSIVKGRFHFDCEHEQNLFQKENYMLVKKKYVWVTPLRENFSYLLFYATKRFQGNLYYVAVWSKYPYQNTLGVPVLFQKLYLFHIEFVILCLSFKNFLNLWGHFHLWLEPHPVAVRNQELEAVRTYPLFSKFFIYR